MTIILKKKMAIETIIVRRRE